MARSPSMVKKVNALKARQHLEQLLEEVYYKGDQFVIERAGKPMAAVVPLWQLEEWQQRREQFFAAGEDVEQQKRAEKPAADEQGEGEGIPARPTKTRRRKG